jgi:hypothetical protein
MWIDSYDVLRYYSNIDIANICGFHNITIFPVDQSTLKISNINYILSSSYSYMSNVTASCLALLYAVVIEMPLVFAMQIDREIIISNYYGVQDLQTGTSHGGSPYFDKGLNGTGQIIGSCDTGLDMNSCYFEENSSGINKNVR